MIFSLADHLKSEDAEKYYGTSHFSQLDMAERLYKCWDTGSQPKSISMESKARLLSSGLQHALHRTLSSALNRLLANSLSVLPNIKESFHELGVSLEENGQPQMVKRSNYKVWLLYQC